MTQAPIPLAERLRPKRLSDVVGQEHLLGAGKPIAVAFESGMAHSCILWGPPGVGKTTIARLMAHAFDAHFIQISAVLGGVKDIREAVEAATRERSGLAQRGTVLFIDEIHRFNKAQQDALLPHVESGLVTFIGATTENPSFEVNSALLSRSQVHVLRALGADALGRILQQGLQVFSDEKNQDIAVDSARKAIDSIATQSLIEHADGDARRLLNTLEAVLHTAQHQGVRTIDVAFLKGTLGEQMRRFDKGGDQFYDQISALHKSVRGSDPDAALYWFCRMLDGGADPRYLARRLIRMASEDIGLADPRALAMCNDAAQAFERLGAPEGELMLAQAVVFLAVAPKSNAVYTAFKAAKALVASSGSAPVPMHLRNAPTGLMKELGHGQGYRYAHDEAGAFAAGERYFPDGVNPPTLYAPTDRGMEAQIAQKLAQLRGQNANAPDLGSASRAQTPGTAAKGYSAK